MSMASSLYAFAAATIRERAYNSSLRSRVLMMPVSAQTGVLRLVKGSNAMNVGDYPQSSAANYKNQK